MQYATYIDLEFSSVLAVVFNRELNVSKRKESLMVLISGFVFTLQKSIKSSGY